jgi:hypothetical protein
MANQPIKIKIADLKAELTKKGVAFDPKAKQADLQKLLDAQPGEQPSAPTAPVAAVPHVAQTIPSATPQAPVPSDDELAELEVADPEELRPVELPLVIKPKNGEDWKNEEQATYARILNGYSYKNPGKWRKKKAALLARLIEIGNDPSALNKYLAPGELGEGQKVEFKDKRFQK